MRVNQIRIQNFRRFKELSLDFSDNMTVLIGNNGVGKSSILDAVSIAIGSIFLGVDGVPSPSFKKEDIRRISTKVGSMIDRQPQYPVVLSCTGEIDGKQVAWERKQKCESGNTVGSTSEIKGIAEAWQQQIRSGMTDVDLPLISYYGTSRLWATVKSRSTKQIDNRFQGYADCLSAGSHEKQMLEWFEKMTYVELQEQTTVPELQAVRSAIIDSYVESGIDTEDVDVRFNVKEHQLELTYCDTNGTYQRHPFRELSDGYRNTLCMIADIAYRMAVLNPQYLGDVTKKPPVWF